ncbi:glyoxalase [Paraburkholderia sp. CNPSo 3272]|uniref:glyoxalase n=1 Tax=Paraburkholderia sp. CNPSo 3272 TaxID=2940931 RepID=UPI0020B6A60D|nr:glyoxalase [Paraburkholderia sp. CNPSo 3272]MCP3724280.1 glyoxalase [Paraburkholderia sp. CNPSo 3272]
MKAFRSALLALMVAGGLVAAPASFAKPPVMESETPAVAVGPQYDTTHVYVAPEDFDLFTDSFVATFGGSKSKQGVFQVTPTPSQTMSQLVFTPSGTISVFGFKTPVPYPFGSERTGYLVTDMDAAVKAARAHGADVIVDTFPDPIGRDAIISWADGVNMQLYWHNQAPHYDALQMVPENRVYVSPKSLHKLVHDFVKFSHGKVVSDEAKAPGVEIGRPDETYRRVRIESGFGKMTVLVTDGRLPYPFGRETTGYEVANLDETLQKAQAAGVKVLVPAFTSNGRNAAIVQFPGGYIAEIHANAAK